MPYVSAHCRNGTSGADLGAGVNAMHTADEARGCHDDRWHMAVAGLGRERRRGQDAGLVAAIGTWPESQVVWSASAP